MAKIAIDSQKLRVSFLGALGSWARGIQLAEHLGALTAQLAAQLDVKRFWLEGVLQTPSGVWPGAQCARA